ncbi:MAG: hypothetical protein QOG43_653 [Actinomycetota bacterium]|jgi:hypothetical protein|nr:hypothetical protein [Actinomycetota bacterium]
MTIHAASAAVLAFLLPFVAAPPAPARQETTPPAADAAVEGIVVHQDGSPAAGVPVTVEGYDDPGLAGFLTLFFSLGFACLFDACGGQSTDGAGATTGADGGYRGSLPGSYVAGTETDTDWTVTAALPPAEGQVRGPSSEFEFEVNIAVQAAPPLPLWEETPTFSVDGWEATVSVDGDPPAGTGRPTVSIATSGGTISSPAPTATVDLRRLESDRSTSQPSPPAGYASAYADVRVPHANGRTIYHQVVSTGVVGLPAIDLTPPSRGAACTLAKTDGTVVSVPRGQSCSATDGNRSGPVGSYGTESITVELDAPVEMVDVFVVGCLDECTVEASADGVSWTTLAHSWTDGDTATTPYNELLVASPDGPLAARFVRVSGPGGVEGVTEVSVWPAPPVPVPPTTVAPTTIPATTIPGVLTGALPDSPGDDDRGDTAPLAVAALFALALSGAAVALVTVRGRRPA